MYGIHTAIYIVPVSLYHCSSITSLSWRFLSHDCRAMEALPSKPIAGYILCGPVVCFGCKVSNEKKHLVLLGIYYTVTHTVIYGDYDKPL